MTLVNRAMYDLHRLGWSSFQQLCLTITREVLGQTVESFLDSNDGGRDGAFVGHWNRTGNEELSGRLVIQCKFTSTATDALRPSDLTDELSKVKSLVQQNLVDVYVLMTNVCVRRTRLDRRCGLVLRCGFPAMRQ